MQSSPVSLVVAFMCACNVYSAQWTRDLDALPSISISSSSMGSGLSFFDVDEDGWDDITIASSGFPTLYYHNNQGTFELSHSFPNSGEAKSCVWADIDNDGDNDLIVARFNLNIQIFRNEGDASFTELPSPIPDDTYIPANHCGLALGDVDRDAFLDLAVANWSFYTPNNLFMNDHGVGWQSAIQSELTSEMRLSFQPAFADINADLYPELFFCNDHDLGNEFYVMGPGGNYDNQSISSGLYHPADAMSSTWCDVDHDSDLDLFMTNTPMMRYLLMRNNGIGQFEEDTVSDLTHNLQGWGGLFVDAENDGWEDLFICTEQSQSSSEGNNIYLHNINGILHDQEISGMTDLTTAFYSNAKGDYNHDGRYDVIAYPTLSQPLHVFENTASNTSHFMKFKLNGRWSNRNGFGVHYTCYCGDLISHGYTQCGDNYLSQNSQNIILGIGTFTQVDSLKLVWPSGITDAYYTIPADQFLQLIEGETWGDVLIANDPCGLSQPTASVSPQFTHVEWSNGEMESHIIAVTDDSLSVTVSTDFGRSVTLERANINISTASVYWEITPPPCSNSFGSAHLLWENETNNQLLDTLFQLSAGDNYLTYHSPAGCTTSDTITVQADHSFELLQATPHGVCPSQSTGTLDVWTETIYASGQRDTILHVLTELIPGWNSGWVTEEGGCSVTWSTWIPQSHWSISKTPPLCPGDSTGQIIVEYFQDTLCLFADTLSQLPAGEYALSYSELPDGCADMWSDTLHSIEAFEWLVEAPEMICPGDSFLLAAQVVTEAEVAAWYGPSDDSNLEAGTYELAIQTLEGCTSHYSFTVNTPTPPLIIANVDNSEGTTVIELSNASSDSWSCVWEDGSVGDSYTVNTPGMYSWTITDAYLCAYEDSLFVEAWTGMQAPNSAANLKLTAQGISANFTLHHVYLSAMNGQIIRRMDRLPAGEALSAVPGVYVIWSDELKPQRIVVR